MEFNPRSSTGTNVVVRNPQTTGCIPPTTGGMTFSAGQSHFAGKDIPGGKQVSLKDTSE